MINGEDLVRYFSEIEDERYYSDYEVEDLYERAFSEGYEYAQREFNSKAAKLAKNIKAMKSVGVTYPEGAANVLMQDSKALGKGNLEYNHQRIQALREGRRKQKFIGDIKSAPVKNIGLFGK